MSSRFAGLVLAFPKGNGIFRLIMSLCIVQRMKTRGSCTPLGQEVRTPFGQEASTTFE